MRPAVRTYGSRIKADNKNCAIIIEVTRQHPEYHDIISRGARVSALWSVQRVDIASIAVTVFAASSLASCSTTTAEARVCACARRKLTKYRKFSITHT